MTPEKFCQVAMAVYERQWAAAAGHQERHPLRVKIEQLRELTGQAADADEFERLLTEGCESDDAPRALLFAELQPWWQRLQSKPAQF